MRLDQSMPYDAVAGVPGVAYSQGGCFFDNLGHPVELHSREVTGFDEDGVQWRRNEHYVTKLPVAAEPEPEPSESETPFRAMHWKQLKVLVESYGHAWADKADAVAFLEGSLAGEDVAYQPGRHEQDGGQ